MPIVSNSKFEKSFFPLYFMNKDISFSIQRKALKFQIHVHKGYKEGSVSQIFYLVPSFAFTES